ncbi:hypothetical protein BIT28_19440 [Photobacterium proteolyticum]|uniref:Uncharacterized protein n=1 Tax=Photobacterium proteolyticum TaxID=1903952 RepID=A0A1Q9GHV5_9GAMM|nr:hypothetical protein [Photobacterium proteolyticum]OLQ74061.1 hypothetical protein BIT28_19440 [Photobacterium proteolyticum]
MGMLSWLFRPKHSESKSSHYAPLSKYYAFNETGNVMVCTTNEGAEVVSDALKHMFSDMSIFFAAMTKAIATHKDAQGKANSIYSSDAILKILDKSEFFVEAKRESIKASSSAVGDTMSKELTESILGREFGESRLHFSRGLFRTMSCRLEDAKKAELDGDAGSIFFVCENILGLPMVSAVVVTLKSPNGKGRTTNGNPVDEDKGMAEILDTAEDEPAKGIIREWEFDKRTYIFISPRSISGANFPEPGDDVEYETLVASLKEHLMLKTDKLENNC